MPRRSQADTAQTRSTIVESAVDMASTDGLEGLTIGRLAETVGMSKSGLIRHFGSKERLQLAALESATERFIHEVWMPVADEEPGMARLEAMCESWLSYIERGVFPGGCFLSAASLEFDDRPGPVRDRVADTMERWLDLLASEARRAQADGDLSTSAAPRQIAFELNAAFMGANWAHRLLRSPEVFASARTAIDRVLSS
jgi:AcrR family transcriptional regulator